MMQPKNRHVFKSAESAKQRNGSTTTLPTHKYQNAFICCPTPAKTVVFVKMHCEFIAWPQVIFFADKLAKW